MEFTSSRLKGINIAGISQRFRQPQLLSHSTVSYGFSKTFFHTNMSLVAFPRIEGNESHFHGPSRVAGHYITPGLTKTIAFIDHFNSLLMINPILEEQCFFRMGRQLQTLSGPAFSNFASSRCFFSSDASLQFSRQGSSYAPDLECL